MSFNPFQSSYFGKWMGPMLRQLFSVHTSAQGEAQKNRNTVYNTEKEWALCALCSACLRSSAQVRVTGSTNTAANAASTHAPHTSLLIAWPSRSLHLQTGGKPLHALGHEAEKKKLGTEALTVESVRSRCHLLMGSLLHMWSMVALAMPRLPSLFSKSIGFTLCGIVEEPTCTSRCGGGTSRSHMTEDRYADDMASGNVASS